MKDTRSSMAPVSSLTPIVVNNDSEGKGAAVDLTGYDGAVVLFHIGVSGDTLSGTVLLTLRMQDSSTVTDGDFVDVAADKVIGTNAVVIDDPAEDDVVVAMGYLGSKRYVRAFIDTTGTHTTGTPCSAVVVKGRAKVEPA